FQHFNDADLHRGGIDAIVGGAREVSPAESIGAGLGFVFLQLDIGIVKGPAVAGGAGFFDIDQGEEEAAENEINGERKNRGAGGTENGGERSEEKRAGDGGEFVEDGVETEEIGGGFFRNHAGVKGTAER